MAQFLITSPEGKKYNIKMPDGATKEDALNKLKEHLIGSRQNQQEPPSKTESAIRGAAQGATMGFADEATAALVAPFSDKTYQEVRDESRAKYAAAQEANPGTYLAGELAGGIGTAVAPAIGIARGVKGLTAAERLAATQKATAASKIGKSVGVGTGVGGVSGVGYSSEEKIGDIASDAATSAAIGGIAAPVMLGATSLGKYGISRLTGTQAPKAAETEISRLLTARDIEGATPDTIKLPDIGQPLALTSEGIGAKQEVARLLKNPELQQSIYEKAAQPVSRFNALQEQAKKLGTDVTPEEVKDVAIQGVQKLGSSLKAEREATYRDLTKDLFNKVQDGVEVSRQIKPKNFSTIMDDADLSKYFNTYARNNKIDLNSSQPFEYENLKGFRSYLGRLEREAALGQGAGAEKVDLFRRGYKDVTKMIEKDLEEQLGEGAVAKYRKANELYTKDMQLANRLFGEDGAAALGIIDDVDVNDARTYEKAKTAINSLFDKSEAKNLLEAKNLMSKYGLDNDFKVLVRNQVEQKTKNKSLYNVLSKDADFKNKLYTVIGKEDKLALNNITKLGDKLANVVELNSQKIKGAGGSFNEIFKRSTGLKTSDDVLTEADVSSTSKTGIQTEAVRKFLTYFTNRDNVDKELVDILLDQQRGKQFIEKFNKQKTVPGQYQVIMDTLVGNVTGNQVAGEH